MKKLFLILAIALGMSALQSCKCSTDSAVASAEFVYDVIGTAEGDGGYAYEWSAKNHTGVVSVDGTAVITVKATNDTTTVKLLTDGACMNAMPLSAGLASEDPAVKEAAEGAQNRLMVEGLQLNGLKGCVKLALTGYVKYGMMVFALDEHWQYPPVDTVAVECVPVDTVVVVE